MKKVILTEQEKNGIYELLAEYLFDKGNPPKVGCLGISPDGYVGLVHLWERLFPNKDDKKTDYKKLLKLKNNDLTIIKDAIKNIT